MGEFGVSDKEDKKNSSTGVYGLGLKVQNVEAVPCKTMMMMVPSPHNHHIPQLAPFVNDPSSAAAAAAAADADGPISMTYYTNHFLNGASASASGAAPLRPLQPFHIPSSSSGATTYTAFKSSGGIMAASLGFPFTNAQWKELERQAMIYKYLMASVPVPTHLLIATAASLSPLDSGFNLRFSSSGSDAEPGRCRRTDGKKWRCSRDVAPNHKYCERHMHRGRPRSRKPVELQPKTNNDNQLIKRIRHDYTCFPAPAVTTMAASNTIVSNEGSSSQFHESTTSTTSQLYFESSLSLDNKFGVKAAQFDSLASVSSNKEPRGLEWMLKGDPICMAASDPEWQPLIQSKLGMNTGITCNNNASVSTSNYRDPLHMNSYEGFSCGLEHHNNRSPLCPIPQSVKPRGFIDAWSNAETEENSSIKKNYAASNPKLSLSSLDLSMGGGLDEDTGSIHMGLGLMEPPAPWAASSTPGGPLAEVLRPTTTSSNNETASASHPSSPSGVLQRTLASLSDSSSSSSPNVSTSRANSEMAFLFFNYT